MAGRYQRLLRETLHGSTQDFTDGPIERALVLLAVPMVLETVLESLFAVVDIVFVAHLGADAIATVGLTESLMSLIYAVAIGLGIGAAAIVSRRIGAHEAGRASHAGGQAITLGVLVSVPIALAGITWAPDLLGVLGGSAAVRRAGAGYTRVLLGGNAAVLLLFLINAVFSRPVPLLPNPFARYMQRTVPPPAFTNAPKMEQLIKDGKLFL